MAKARRVKLVKHESQIRAWVREGHSDAWIGSALGSSGNSIQSFRSRLGIYRRTDEPDLSGAVEYEGALEHDEGEGLWLDPAVSDSGTWRRWRNVEDVSVRVSGSRIIITPA